MNPARQLPSRADQIGDAPDQEKCAANEQQDHDPYAALTLAVLADRPGPVWVGEVVDHRDAVAFAVSIAAVVEVDSHRGRFAIRDETHVHVVSAHIRHRPRGPGPVREQRRRTAGLRPDSGEPAKKARGAEHGYQRGDPDGLHQAARRRATGWRRHLAGHRRHVIGHRRRMIGHRLHVIGHRRRWHRRFLRMICPDGVVDRVRNAAGLCLQAKAL